ncbi:MAG TPA: PD-(D/E)XK nuclease family protein [Allosphingosinicella sp.]
MTPGDLLFFIRGRLVAQRTTKAVYAERLAPDFSIFDFLDTRENGLSRVIAWLLDPMGSHAQGERFLVAFIGWLGLGEEWKDRAATARSWTEVSTGAGSQRGYIDILVRCGGRALAIENKPSALDQPLQVERYLDDLADKCREGHCLLYLSGSGDGPSESSIATDRAEAEIDRGTLVVRGYPALVSWLESCLSMSKAASVSVTIEGLAKHVRKEFMGVGDIHETSDLAQAVCENSGLVDAALALLEAEPSIRARIIERFDGAVRERIAGRKGWHVVRSNLGPERYSGLLIGFAAESTIGFGFQFDQARYGWLFYGVASENGRALPPRTKSVLKAFMNSESGTEYWPVWKSVGPNDRHFPFAKQADREFWLAAYDGRLADMLVRFVEEAEAALESAGLMAAVRSR